MDNQSEGENIEIADEHNEHKNIRHRKRKFYNSVREQMEFYFGDANLLKDRFLMQLIKKDAFVPLETFLKFNKMKKLVNSIDDIGKSLSNSKVLELNDDKTKVRRIAELPNNEKYNSDSRTIYVEGIPSTADHDSLKKIFSHISGGQVVYVSLPKYKKSRKIKEFGFIEFENELCVEKCLKAFQLFNGVLGTQQNIDPSQLTSIKTFIKEQNDEIENNTEKTTENLKLSNVEEQHKHSSQSESGSLESSSEPASKRMKLSIENINENIVDNKHVHLEEKKCDNTESNKNYNLVDTTSDDMDNSTAQNKNDNLQKNNRKRKKTKMHKTIKKDFLNIDLNIQQLKILQKKEWKRLRNKYLNMQREKIADLKRKNWEKNCAQHQQQENNGKTKNIKLSSTATSCLIAQPSTTNQVKKFEIIKSPHHMNFYMVNKEIDGNTDDDDNNDKLKKSYPELISKNKKANENLTLKTTNTIQKNEPIRNLADEKSPLFTYESGTIVNIRFLEPCLELKSFKSDMKQYDFVKYVDIKEAALEAHIRCDSNKMSQQLCKKIQSAEYNCKILSGEAEKLYWSKIMQDREMKLNKTVKIKTKRGREKIPKIIANHIRFGDDE